ncbi:TauD/TfdA dioxygenase family protein [Hyphococcus luteus]|uniref:Taurine dioxygenase n=1 Tax=Hyphococcus luteus TaxID=2058213 RepID=A0A2S7K2W5_9PROT|nr:TauD/TfdA family dioxygenase [Marinicaulis flavus]PQA86835.1 taurine dioxygenase [Marinicaulis flavus]
MLIHPTGKFDNTARDYKTITAHPLAAAMGAEIRGADFTNMSDDQFAEIEDALFHHKMIYFRDVEWSHDEHEAFSLRFGDWAEDAYTDGIPGHLNIQPLVREADAKGAHIFGSGWHSDGPFLANPPAIALLYGVEIPPFGGDTIWANTVLAYETLSETMKELLAPLRVHMSMKHAFESSMDYGEADDSPVGKLAKLKGLGVNDLPEHVVRKVKGNFHPLIRTHPRSGEKSIYFDPSYTIGFEGMTPPEAEALMGFLTAHLTQPAFTCRLRWAPKTLAVWDNRISIHQAFNDYDGYRRELYRTTIAGEAPA